MPQTDADPVPDQFPGRSTPYYATPHMLAVLATAIAQLQGRKASDYETNDHGRLIYKAAKGVE